VDRATFWKIIDRSRNQADGGLDEQVKQLRTAVETFEAAEIVEFGRIFTVRGVTSGLPKEPSLRFKLVFCKAGVTCVKYGLRWSIGRGPPRSMPGKGPDNQSTQDDHPKR
jgi:Protein of unknown function (DUF4240)